MENKTIELPESIKYDICMINLQIQEWRNGWVVRYRNYTTIDGGLCFIEPFRCWSKSLQRAKNSMFNKLKKRGLI